MSQRGHQTTNNILDIDKGTLNDSDFCGVNWVLPLQNTGDITMTSSTDKINHVKNKIDNNQQLP